MTGGPRELRAGLCPVNELTLGRKTLDNDEAGEDIPGLWSSDGYRLIGTYIVESAGLGAGEPLSEAVQALSAPGVAGHVSEAHAINLRSLFYMQPDLRHTPSVPESFPASSIDQSSQVARRCPGF
jgi:hypothetical protein